MNELERLAPPDFATAVEQGIVAARNASLRKLALAVVFELVIGSAVVWLSDDRVLMLFAYVALVLGTAIIGVVSTRASSSPLERFRGAAPPELWVPSPSHGVLLVHENTLVAGSLRGQFDRHATPRVESVSYDEVGHGLQLQLYRLVQTRDGEQEERAREFVTLDRSVTAERGYALAKQLLALSQR